MPPELFELKNLEVLNLNDNQLKEIPKEIGKLENLKSLSLIFNNLTTLPEEIKKLKKLQYINMIKNPIGFEEQQRLRRELPSVTFHFEFASQTEKPELYFERAIEFYQKKEYVAAQYYCSQSLRIKPDYAEALSLRGFLRVISGDKVNGCPDLQKAGKLGDAQAVKFAEEYCK